MDEKLNDYLIQEINKSIEDLNQNKEQLIEELKKYEGKYGAIEKAELEQDLSKIDSELEVRRLDKAKIETRREIVAQIKEEQEKAEKEYQKLLKEREDCEAEINGLAGKKEFVDGVLVPTKEQQEFEQDLEKINASIAKFEKLREQHTKDLNEHNTVIDSLLKKYNIREKYKSELEEKQDTPTQEAKRPEENKEATPVIDSTQKDNKTKQAETIIVEGPTENEGLHKETDASDVLKSIDKSLEDLKNPNAQKTQTDKVVVPKNVEPKQQESSIAKPTTKESKPKQEIIKPEEQKTDAGVVVQPNEVFKNIEVIELPRKIQDITCSVIEGKLVYTISGIDEAGKQFSVDRETTPKRLTREEKRSLSRKIDKYSIGNIDAQIYRILKNDKFFKNTSLVYDYMDQIDRLSSFENEERDDDMAIKYDLQNLNTTKLSFLQKGQIKSTARRNFMEGIAEYIKPKSRFKIFMEKMKQKSLPAGNQEKQAEEEKDDIITKQGEEMPREDRIYSTYKDLSREEGFDFEKFCEDMELTPEERKELEVYEKVNADSKAFHKGIKNPVTYKEDSLQPNEEKEQRLNEPKTNEQEDKEL